MTGSSKSENPPEVLFPEKDVKLTIHPIMEQSFAIIDDEIGEHNLPLKNMQSSVG